MMMASCILEIKSLVLADTLDFLHKLLRGANARLPSALLPFAFEAAVLLAAGVRPHGMSTLIGRSPWQPKATSKGKGISDGTLLVNLLFSQNKTDIESNL
ncbi:hypothetical protein [Candidatus Regiella insecticola]|uniref:hypothetical protein n=1 Tax=Candidatus Regiella insecticola TaxID=138073 RepID=UPI001ED90BFC|nr:hypothetical protein [Candidatus Regiella insecticola]